MNYGNLSVAEAKYYLSKFKGNSEGRIYPKNSFIRENEIYFINLSKFGILRVLAVSCFGGENYTYSWIGREIE